MTDREYLELAAKAAGIEVWFDGNGTPWVDGDKYVWNPITDDGDAFRLAVKLNMTVGEHLGARHAGRPPCPDDYEDGGYPVRIAQMDNGDPYAATRRAIVRAAAEIGKGMK